MLPRLFEGLDALGGQPRLTARLAQQAGLGPRARVLDLGCGKGAVAVELARRNGCRVTGIDACEPFVESARALAERRGVAHRCVFRVGDFHHLRRERLFDGVVMLNAAPLERAAAICRRVTGPGGVYIIDDVVRWRGRALPAGVRVLDREEARARVEADGDRVMAEHIPTPSRLCAMSERLARRIERNVLGLEREHPRLRPALREFVRRHREAGEQLTGPIRPVIWVVRCGRAT